MGASLDLSKSPVPEILAALSTDPHKGLDAAAARNRLAKYGPNALEEKKTGEWVLFLRFFWGPMPWMIEAAALMAAIVRDWGDFTIIVALLVFNAVLGFFEEHQASNALQALKNALALKAKVLRDGSWSEIDAKEIVPGDIVRIRLGDVVPADGRIISGDYLSVDQAALTGESLPVSKKPGDILYSGSIAKQGEVQAVVTETGAHTYFGRTASLVQSAGAASHFQAAVMRIGDFLIAMAGILAVILVAVQLSRGADILKLAEFVLILLVASVPVAMPAVLSVTMALGAKLLAREKAIVSRLESIEEMAGMEVLCSDKTGTLTQNKLTLGEVSPWRGADPGEVLLVASLASKAEDRDPIDLAVLSGLQDQSAPKAYVQSAFQPFDPVTKRTEATVKGPGEAVFRAAKGAPQVILALSKLEGADLDAANKEVDAYAAKGFRTLGVARTDANGAWRFLGFIPLYDPPRADSRETIAKAERYGVRVKMVTGDDVAIAQQIAGDLGLGANIQPATELFRGDVAKGDVSLDIAARIEAADGFARVFPEHKYAIVKALQERGYIVGMTGDGVNDAPALKQSDIGVAVSGATDAARAAAALILTAPGLSTIIKGIEEARRIFERMMSYTLYRIAMTLDIMVFIVLATVVYGFFPLTPVMIIMLALLDDIPIMTIAFDRAQAPDRPVRWQMDRVLVVSSVLGTLAVMQSFGLLAIGQNVLRLDAPHLQTILFLQLVVGGHLMLFVTRTKGPFWTPPFPGPALFWAIIATQALAALLCAYGVLVPALPWEFIGLVWAYNIAWMFVQDLAKLAIYRELAQRAAKATLFLARLTTRLHASGGRRTRFASPTPQGGNASSGHEAANQLAVALGLVAVAVLLWAGHSAFTRGAVQGIANPAPAASTMEQRPEKSVNAAPNIVAEPRTAPAPVAQGAAEHPDEKTMTAPRPTATQAAAERVSVRLGALPTEARAKSKWRQLQKRAPGLLAQRQPLISKKGKDGRAAWFLEVVDFGSKAEAAEFCQAIQARGERCELVVGE